MLEGDGGLGSEHLLRPWAGRREPGLLAYGTAKGALTHYTRLAAADLSPRIRVNAIAVGSVATSALDIVMQTDELREALESGTPLKRIGDAEDIAATVVYLSLRRRLLHHREDPRGQRGHRVPQPRHGPARRHRLSRDSPLNPTPDRPARSPHDQDLRVVAW